MRDIYLEKPLVNLVKESTKNKYNKALTKIQRTRHQNALFFLIKHLKKGAMVLDLGCGSGHIAAALKHIRPDLKVVGVTPGKVHPFWKSINKYYDIKFTLGTGFDIPFKNNFFDAVLSFGVMEHVHEFYEGDGSPEDLYLDEVNRVLKKNGVFFISHLPNVYSLNEKLSKFFGLHYHIRPYTKKEAIKILKKHKFRIEKFHREHIIPSYVPQISAKLSKLYERSFWLVLGTDNFLKWTPARFLCQSFLIVARKK